MPRAVPTSEDVGEGAEQIIAMQRIGMAEEQGLARSALAFRGEHDAARKVVYVDEGERRRSGNDLEEDAARGQTEDRQKLAVAGTVDRRGPDDGPRCAGASAHDGFAGQLASTVRGERPRHIVFRVGRLMVPAPIAAWLEMRIRRAPVALTAPTMARVPDTLNSKADASSARVRPAAWTTTSDSPIAADKVAE